MFDLDTSTRLADAYSSGFPDRGLSEHAMDGYAQLDALLTHRLDVAVVRVTRRMLHEHPSGWRHGLLRFEPLVIVGSDADDDAPVALTDERGLVVLADPVGSGSYNAYSEYLSALERELSSQLTWAGAPGSFDRCLARIRRLPGSRHLELLSHAERYADIGIPITAPSDRQPYYPWSIAWRTDDISSSLRGMLDTAAELSASAGWTEPWDRAVADAWWPLEEPYGTAERHLRRPVAEDVLG